MQLLGLLMPVLGIVAFVGWVWLVVVAFRRHWGWGLAVFFLSPFGAIALAVRYWEESKKPFLLYAGSMAGIFLLFFVMIGVLGGMVASQVAGEMQAAREGESGTAFVEEDSLAPEGQAPRPARAAAAPGRIEAPPAADVPDVRAAALPGDGALPFAGATPAALWNPPAQASAEPLPGWAPAGPIAVGDARRHVGRRVRVVGTDGLEFRGRLASVDSDGLLFAKDLASGTFSVKLEPRQIEILELVD